MKFFVSIAIGVPAILTMQHVTYLFGDPADFFFYGALSGIFIRSFIGKVYQQ